ncbi:MAG: SymE family type I addiction module toxin [Acidithiobacillus sp.]
MSRRRAPATSRVNRLARRDTRTLAQTLLDALPPLPPPDLQPDPLPTRRGRLSAPRRARQPRQCTVSCTYYPGAHGHGGDQPVPHLRLSGLWLEQLGFAIGAKLRITAQDGRLVIELPAG